MKGLASRAAKPELNPELKKGGKTDWSKITFGGKKVYALIDEIKAAMSSERLAREKYPSIFKYYDGLIGTKISHSVHPAGIVISPIDLISNYGVFEKDGENVMMIDMEEIHEVGLAKYDFLILKNVEIIQDIFKAIGKPYPRSDEIDWDDQNVWEDMLKSPAGIFQMEGDFAFSLLKKFEPHSIFDMSLVTAAIRPSGASYRDDLIAHKPNHNPSPQIDELLKENNGYLIYQEDVIAFLQEVCGLSGSAADSIRRGIARKKPEILEKAMPDILAGYCKNSSQPPEIAKKEAMTFLKIIEDASSYMFGKNHSIAYCLIGYLCAYLRYYYPGEFITSYLNNAANQDDISAGTELAKQRGIPMLSIRFGHSGAQYVYDKNLNAIYKGIASIKYMNAGIADSLFSLNPDDFHSFTDVLEAVSFLDARQLEILINLDFFADFGSSERLLEVARIYRDIFNCGKAKTIAPGKLVYDMPYDKYCDCLTKSGKPMKSLHINDFSGLMKCVEQSVMNDSSLKGMGLAEKIDYQKEYLGYSDLVTNKEEDRRKIIVNGVFPAKRKSDGEIFAYNILARSVGSGKESRLTVFKKTFEGEKFSKGDILEAGNISKNSRGYWCLLDYKKLS